MSIIDSAKSLRFYLRRVYLNQGGYDRTGTYWGVGQPLYWYEGAYQDESFAQCIDGHLRADDREHAIAKLSSMYPGSTFAKGIGK